MDTSHLASRRRRALAVASRLLVVPLLCLAAHPAGAQTLRVWGDDTYGQISTAPTGDVRAVSGGSLNGLALQRDGTPYLWGNGPIGPTPVPDALADQRFFAVAVARDDVVLIRTDGTLAAFGRNLAQFALPPGSFNAVAVSAANAVAIADDGTLAAWGSPAASLTRLLNAPDGGPFVEVDSVVSYALALHDDGTLFGWGYGAQGTNVLAGWPSTPDDLMIYYRPGEQYKAIAAGNVHVLAIRLDGTVTGWGRNDNGALDAPSHVRFKAVAAGWGFSVGLATDGTLWGWGTPHSLVTPFPTRAWTFASEGWTRYGDTGWFFVAGERFKAVDAAAFHVMAITAGRASARTH